MSCLKTNKLRHELDFQYARKESEATTPLPLVKLECALVRYTRPVSRQQPQPYDMHIHAPIRTQHSSPLRDALRTLLPNKATSQSSSSLKPHARRYLALQLCAHAPAHTPAPPTQCSKVGSQRRHVSTASVWCAGLDKPSPRRVGGESAVWGAVGSVHA